MLTPITLARDQRLQKQIFDQLHHLILSGRFTPGARMPSTRMLADQFGISRTTALLVYERLIAEGYLETRPAQGTFVARQLPVASGHAPAPLIVEAGRHSSPADVVKRDAPHLVGRPDPSLFPMRRWRALMRDALDGLCTQHAAVHPTGHPTLRAAVASWLSTTRGVAVAADQVFLLNGRHQALHLASHLVLRPGVRVVMEDPGDEAVAALFVGESAEVLRIPIDEHGLRSELLPEGPVALAHVTPEHQYPLGVRMSQARRTELLAWAQRSDAMILEDDCPGELHYCDQRPPTLAGEDHDGRVLLLGGFAISLGPWVTISYLVVPRRKVAAANAACLLFGDGPSRLEQTALCDLLSGGWYMRHMHRLTKTYASRRDTLVSALRTHFPGDGLIWGHHAGLHLSWFPDEASGSPHEIAAMARHCGLDALALPHGSMRRTPGGNPVLLGFGSLPEIQITASISRLAMHVADCRNVALSAD
jgi:GntR family transcriptional regulator/MocR family aminotransferase